LSKNRSIEILSEPRENNMKAKNIYFRIFILFTTENKIRPIINKAFEYFEIFNSVLKILVNISLITKIKKNIIAMLFLISNIALSLTVVITPIL
jgi:hypothetical protein